MHQVSTCILALPSFCVILVSCTLVQLLCGENAECASLVSCSKQNMKCLRNVNVTAEFMLAGIIVLIS